MVVFDSGCSASWISIRVSVGRPPISRSSPKTAVLIALPDVRKYSGAHRPRVVLAHEVAHALIRRALALARSSSTVHFTRRLRLALDRRVVVDRVAQARQVAVRHVAEQTLDRRDPHRPRDRRQEEPHVVAAHQERLPFAPHREEPHQAVLSLHRDFEAGLLDDPIGVVVGQLDLDHARVEAAAESVGEREQLRRVAVRRTGAPSATITAATVRIVVFIDDLQIVCTQLHMARARR